MDVSNVPLPLSFTVSLTEEFRWHWLLIEGMWIEHKWSAKRRKESVLSLSYRGRELSWFVFGTLIFRSILSLNLRKFLSISRFHQTMYNS